MARRVTQSIVDEIAEEYSSGELKALFRRLRAEGDERLRLAARRSETQVDAEGVPKNVPFQEPADSLLGKAIRDRLEVEEAIARIRERHMKTMEPAHRILLALTEQKQTPVTVQFAPESEDDGKKPPEDA